MEVVLIDYQFLYYGSPVNDFIYFIFSGTDKEFRRKHLTYLKDHYYNTMDAFMKHFDVHVEEVFPKAEYERQFKENLDYGLVQSIYMLPMLLAEEEDVVDLEDTKVTDVKCCVNDKVKVRMQEVVDDFIEWGYL